MPANDLPGPHPYIDLRTRPTRAMCLSPKQTRLSGFDILAVHSTKTILRSHLFPTLPSAHQPLSKPFESPMTHHHLLTLQLTPHPSSSPTESAHRPTPSSPAHSPFASWHHPAMMKPAERCAGYVAAIRVNPLVQHQIPILTTSTTGCMHIRRSAVLSKFSVSPTMAPSWHQCDRSHLGYKLSHLPLEKPHRQIGRRDTTELQQAGVGET
ncbi:hypothetical protein J3F83DRAFT_210107 [Trichoderma novae-zelandiae]